MKAKEDVKNKSIGRREFSKDMREDLTEKSVWGIGIIS